MAQILCISVSRHPSTVTRLILINNCHWYVMCDGVVPYNRLGAHTQPFAIWRRPIDERMEDLLLTPRLGVQKVAYKTNSFCTWDEIDS